MNHKMNDERVSDDHCFLSVTVRHYYLHMRCYFKSPLELNSIARYLSIKIIVIGANKDWEISY